MVSNLVNPFGSPHGSETGISKGYQQDADRETGLNVVIVAHPKGFEPLASAFGVQGVRSLTDIPERSNSYKLGLLAPPLFTSVR